MLFATSEFVFFKNAAVVTGAKVKEARRNSNPLLAAVLAHWKGQSVKIGSDTEKDASAAGGNANIEDKAPTTPRGGNESQV